MDHNQDYRELSVKDEAVLVEMSANLTHRALGVTNNGQSCLIPSSARTGDIITTLLGSRELIVLRPLKNEQFQVIGPAYSRPISCGELILVKLPENFRKVVWLLPIGAFVAYLDSESGICHVEDPRLPADLPTGWGRESHDEEEFQTSFVKDDESTGPQIRTWYDPILTPEALMERGVPLREFKLV
jgi:hypothetical protein